jgi:glycerol-3-phosphate cytidylyltransferase
MIRGFTCGAFDLLHSGHLHLFEQAKKQCDYLIIGLHTNPNIDRNRKTAPIQTIFERWSQLNAVKYVDEIIPYDTEHDLKNLLATINLQIRFLGSDYLRVDATVTGKQICYDRNIKIIYIPRLHSFSSSNLRERVQCNAPSFLTETV